MSTKKSTEKSTEKSVPKMMRDQEEAQAKLDAPAPGAGPAPVHDPLLQKLLEEWEEDDGAVEVSRFERVKLKKGQKVKGVFLGAAGVYPYKNEEGETVNIKLWRIQSADGITDLMGDYALDDTFGGANPVAPGTMVYIEALGATSVEGSARQLNQYIIKRGARPVAAFAQK